MPGQTAPRSSDVRCTTQQQHEIGAPEMSSQIGWEKSSQRRRALTYREHFAAIWRDFIRSNFDSPEHAAHVFRVNGRTAENWWEGLNAPSGWVVGEAINNPDLRDAALAAIAAGPAE